MGLRALAIAALLLAAGCGDRTELVLAVDTDLGVPGELDRVRFEITGPRGTRQSAEADLARASLPVTLGLVHEGGPLAPLTIAVIGEQGGSEVLRREARTGFLEGKTLLLRMSLLASCRGLACGDGETCAESGCASAEIDPAGLPDWSGTPDRLDGARPPVDGGGVDGGPDDGDGGGGCGDCDDGVACTVDTCDAAGGCTHTPDHSLCPLGNLCDTAGGGCTPAPTFTSIHGVFASECSPCHTNPPYSADLNMRTRDFAYAELVDVVGVCGAGDNVLVIPGDARNSLLWRKIAAVDLCGARMPNGRTGLPAADIDAVRDWINAGAADN